MGSLAFYHLDTLRIDLAEGPAFSGFAMSMAVGLIMISLFWVNIANYQPLIFVFMFIIGIGTGIYGG